MAPDTFQTAAVAEKPVSVTQATEFVVVAMSLSRSGHYEYYSHDDLRDALDDYRMLEDGEYRNMRAVGIFPARHGVPLGSHFQPAYIMRLMAETRRA